MHDWVVILVECTNISPRHSPANIKVTDIGSAAKRLRFFADSLIMLYILHFPIHVISFTAYS